MEAYKMKCNSCGRARNWVGYKTGLGKTPEQLQEMRKEAGYEVDNRINVWYKGMPEVFDNKVKINIVSGSGTCSKRMGFIDGNVIEAVNI